MKLISSFKASPKRYKTKQTKTKQKRKQKQTKTKQKRKQKQNGSIVCFLKIVAHENDESRVTLYELQF